MDETKHPQTPHAGHETTDVNIWAVGKFGIALVVVCVVSIALLLGLSSTSSRRKRPASPPPWNPTKLFPQPQLQRTPILDLRAIRAEEDKILNSYALGGPAKRRGADPRSQAIEILAKRGLPARHTAAARQPKRYPNGNRLLLARR